MNDEESLVDDDGNFNELGMILGLMAKMHEEDDSPERLQKIIEKLERDTKGKK